MGQAKTLQQGMDLKDAVRIKSAEFWLKLGEPGRALLELQRLPMRAWNHPWTKLVRRAVYRAF